MWQRSIAEVRLQSQLESGKTVGRCAEIQEDGAMISNVEMTNFTRHHPGAVFEVGRIPRCATWLHERDT